MSIDWHSLRSLNGSQQLAFEELCCQLARCEPLANRLEFFRVGSPDGGVECYWKLSNGDEIGWQSKFFLTTPGKSQWSQIDKSIKTALEKRPNLTQYYLCLPINRSDARVDGRRSFMEKWDDVVKKWTEWSKAKNKKITFHYWGESEIWHRLSQADHSGRYYFWFNKQLFNQNWFENQVRPNIENAGERYTPDLNFGLPIAQVFDGLTRRGKFFDRLEKLYKEIQEDFDDTPETNIKILSKDEYSFLVENLETIRPLIFNKTKAFDEELVFSEIKDNCSSMLALSSEICRKLEEERDRLEIESKKIESEVDPRLRGGRKFSSEIRHLEKLYDSTNELRQFINSDEAKLSNISNLLLTGNGGTGKTHLFCDIAEKRLNENLPTILLLGQHFKDEEPWSQILKQLGLPFSQRNAFLNALESAAQARNAKALILIDALNESENRRMWKNHLSGILQTLSGYNWISLAVSVRSTYKDSTIPINLNAESGKIVEVEHFGFSEKVFEATDHFFKEYGIKAPRTPILNPEFQSPLFLKMFCLAIRKAGLSEVPPGVKGISGIFTFFVDSLNKKISDSLGFDLAENPVGDAVEKLTDAMITNGRSFLFYEEAKQIVSQVHIAERHENTLFHHLLSEGLLSKDIKYDLTGDFGEIDIIRFTYERFTDNLIAKRLLDGYLNYDDPKKSFYPEEKLGQYFVDEYTTLNNKGIFEGLFIQVPERLRKELFEIFPACEKWWVTKETFIQSIIWREPDAVFESSLLYVNKYIDWHDVLGNQFRDALLTISMDPQHIWNAEFLHSNLIKRSMAERDFWWSIPIHEHYSDSEHTAIHRLIDWAWSGHDKSHIDDDSIFLGGVSLAWFLTSSNRFLRDRATKALVALFTPRIALLQKLLDKFLSVNDVYVLERLFAAAYGCVMRSVDDDAIAKIAQFTYDKSFKDRRPIPHLLLRDYARGIVEFAVHKKLNVKVIPKRIRPPYNSDFPKRFLKEKTLNERYHRDNYDTEENRSRNRLYNSVMNHNEDFSNYIIRRSLSEWRNRRLDEDLPESHIFKKFEKNLSKRQAKIYEDYKGMRDFIAEYNKSSKEQKLEMAGKLYSKKILEGVQQNCEQRVRQSLSEEKRKVFDKVVLKCLENPELLKTDNNFDISLARRWILQRVYSLGWSPKLFEHFDAWMNHYSRDYRAAKKVERVSKKYQWIALYEFMAYVADNFQFEGDRWSDIDYAYTGPWHDYRRDIDPSNLLKNTETTWWYETRYSWWSTVKYDFDGAEENMDKWMRATGDLPDVQPLIELIDPKDSSVWLNLDPHFVWNEEFEEKRSSFSKRAIKYSLNSYLVRENDLQKVMKWTEGQNFWRSSLPESTENSRIFLGEYYWSPSYQYFNNPYFGHSGWTRGWHDEIPKEVLPTSEIYFCEGGNYDCSIEEGFSIVLPEKFIVEKMNLRWNGKEGCFYDKKGNLVAFTPSVEQKGNQALLIKKDAFLEFLKKHKVGIFWTLAGDKVGYNRDDQTKSIYLDIKGIYFLDEGSLKRAFYTAKVNEDHF